MAKKRTTTVGPRTPTELLIAREEAKSKLEERIQKGVEIKKARVDSEETLDAARNEFRKWDAFNNELLKRIFTTDELAEEYMRWASFAVSALRAPYLGEKIDKLHKDIDAKIHRIDSIIERLELIPLAENMNVTPDRPATSATLSTSKVFIVHGHDEAAREMAARFLERLDLVPIILHEQASGGKTVIEKLEDYSDVGYAVVLLTPDDEGRKKAEGEVYRNRARQNVLLELGYFTGKLGRTRVCALHRGSVEIPTDYLGVLYVPLDEGGGWQLRLARELKAAGFEIDMNKAV